MVDGGGLQVLVMVTWSAIIQMTRRLTRAPRRAPSW